MTACVVNSPVCISFTPENLYLQAKESIEQLVYLCQTDKEDVRDAAKQALLVLGEWRQIKLQTG